MRPPAVTSPDGQANAGTGTVTVSQARNASLTLARVSTTCMLARNTTTRR